mmetsp:Transcript_13363/g.31751  ORF Transcript_13363/g.31751 Transcript_13363/m.31751 type:complete len:224 (-) Transcript_13363:115-786(-)
MSKVLLETEKSFGDLPHMHLAAANANILFLVVAEHRGPGTLCCGAQVHVGLVLLLEHLLLLLVVARQSTGEGTHEVARMVGEPIHHMLAHFLRRLLLALHFVALVEEADRGHRAGVAPAVLEDVERLTVHLCIVHGDAQGKALFLNHVLKLHFVCGASATFLKLDRGMHLRLRATEGAAQPTAQLEDRCDGGDGSESSEGTVHDLVAGTFLVALPQEFLLLQA